MHSFHVFSANSLSWEKTGQMCIVYCVVLLISKEPFII